MYIFTKSPCRKGDLQMLSLKQFSAMNILHSRFSLEYFLDGMKEIGFENIEFWGAAPHYNYMAPQMEQQKSIKRLFRSKGLRMICFTPEQCIYPFNVASKDELIRKMSIDYFLRCIEDAAGFDCEKIMVTPGWGNFDEPAEEAWKRSIDSMGILLSKAEKEGVHIVYEILQPEESNLVTDLKTLKRMMRNLDSPYMACCIDTVPMCCAGETLEDYFREFGDKIQHIHLNDGSPSGHLAWGNGTQNLSEHLKILNEHDYRGFITFETCDGKFALHPNDAFRQDYEAVKNEIIV
jgi:fructoselysine 3-epimerase